MAKVAWLWFLLLSPTIPGKVVLDLTGPHETHGTWRASVILPCLYDPSPDFLEQSVVWRQRDHHNRAIFHRDNDSGDQTPVAHFRDRLTVPKQPLGDVSLLIHDLDMADRGRYACEVTFLTKNNTRVTISRIIILKVKKVPVAKPVIKATNNDETSLPGVMRFNLSCLTTGSPPITYRWFKQVEGSNATFVGKEAVLAFDRLEASDAGRYYCEVENRVSKQIQQSRAIRINVQSSAVPSTLGPSTEFAMSTTAVADATSTAWMVFGGRTTSGSFNSRELTVAKRPATIPATTTATTTGKPLPKPTGSKMSTFAIIMLVLLSFVLTGILMCIVCYRIHGTGDGFPISYFCITRGTDEDNDDDNTGGSDGDNPHDLGRNNRCACSYEYELLNGSADNSRILAPILGLEEEAIELKTVNMYEALVNESDSDIEVLDAPL
ncbi:V-set and immunoglobulin domain-containing protein 4 isoform X1 [Podarcis raffonei]|uniref:V-set and immunoglobulin domain-containing protein 4 isoform X1 n=1 Tax=Podarcis raffonei TaxID=65483 RepID=UPI002329738F|nr:V-set and immunoglobulin domain-containing protein 4 isoform X1 [Podarcis raffonei]